MGRSSASQTVLHRVHPSCRRCQISSHEHACTHTHTHTHTQKQTCTRTKVVLDTDESSAGAVGEDKARPFTARSGPEVCCKLCYTAIRIGESDEPSSQKKSPYVPATCVHASADGRTVLQIHPCRLRRLLVQRQALTSRRFPYPCPAFVFF